MQGITKTIAGVIDMTWPMVIVSIVIIVSVRICYLVKNNEHFSLYKELLMLSMIIYVLMLFQVVTSQDVVNWSSNNFIPFKEMLRYRFGSRLFIKNVLGNLILFLPYGFLCYFVLVIVVSLNDAIRNKNISFFFISYFRHFFNKI